MILLDYLKKTKYKSLLIKKLNNLDILAITLLSYLHLDLVVEDKPITFTHIIRQLDMISKDVSDITGENLKEVFRMMLTGSRFKNIRLVDSVDNFSEENNMQFSATTFKLGNKIIIAYRGTDGTLLGWKENITIGYIEKTPGQLAALEYFRKIMKKFPHKNIYVCGHSKGGNLATFVGLSATKKELKHIKGIWNFDGPGFIDSTLYETKLYEKKVSKKIHKFIPEESIVGVILNKDKYSIVKSKADKAFQHDSFTWECNEKDFIYAEERGPFSLKFEKIINTWYYSIDRDVLKDTLEILQNILGKDLDMKVKDLDLKVKTWIVKYLFYKKIDKESKKKVTDSLLKLYHAYKDANKEEKKNKKEV